MLSMGMCRSASKRAWRGDNGASTETALTRCVAAASALVLLPRSGVDVAVGRCSCQGGDDMSQAGVGIVIDKLLTDEDLRIRFALDQIETVAELRLQGVELTRDEIDLFCQTDARLWFVGDRSESRMAAVDRHAAVPCAPSARRSIRRGPAEATVARVIDEIITVLARREARRLKE